MANIDQLERKILELERRLDVQSQEANRLMAKSNNVLEIAKHAYKVDGFGFLWQWDPNTKAYYRTNMRVLTTEVAERSIVARNIADKAIEGRHLADNIIEGRMVKPKTIDGRSLKDDIIGPELIADHSIPGDSFTPNGVIPGKIADDAVQTRNIKDRNVTSPKIGKGAILPEHVSKHSFNEMAKDIQNQIDSLEISGVALSNEFGDNTHIGISQKTLTDAINAIWGKIEDITGEVLQGINMVVTPTFFVSEDGCDVHISANTVETNGIFEKIQFFVDGEKIYEADNTEYVEPFVYHIDVKDDYNYVIMCKAKIMGIEYTRQQIVTRYNEFYIDAGSTYADVMDSAHARQLNGTMRHNYDITIAEGDKFIIVMGASLASGFIRADLNGVEIEMTEAKLDAEGHVIPEEDTTTEVKFIGFMSEPWSAGDYNIDING